MRAEEEKRLTERKKQEEERRLREAEERRQREIEEKRQRLEEAEKKRQNMMNALKVIRDSIAHPLKIRETIIVKFNFFRKAKTKRKDVILSSQNETRRVIFRRPPSNVTKPKNKSKRKNDYA